MAGIFFVGIGTFILGIVMLMWIAEARQLRIKIAVAAIMACMGFFQTFGGVLLGQAIGRPQSAIERNNDLVSSEVSSAIMKNYASAKRSIKDGG